MNGQKPGESAATMIAYVVVAGYFLALGFVAVMSIVSADCSDAVAGIAKDAAHAAAQSPADAAAVAESIAAAARDLDCTSAEWSDLFKTGFILLGGVVTTVIGYFFGSRGVEGAEQRAVDAQTEAERSSEQSKELQALVEPLINRVEERLRDQLSDTSSTVDESAPGMDDPDASGKD